MKASILIVDDEKDTRELMARALGVDYRVTTAPDAEQAIKALEADPSIVLLLSDVRMPGADGIQLLKAAKKLRPQLACILLTAFGTVDLAVEAMKDGADDFLTKPVDLDQLDLRVAKALKTRALEAEVESLRSELDVKHGLEDITGTSDAMQEVFRLIRQAAPTQATVLIEGPSGTGKELVAHALHALSPRANGPFVAVECAALNGNLLESELFGHEKGAFTDAGSKLIGRFEAADGGTIFLDEISEIPPSTQVKLLRVLETRSFERLGSSETIASAAPRRSTRTSASSPPATATSPSSCARGSSARISITASPSSTSACRRCASAGATSPCSSRASSRSSPPRTATA